MDRITEPAQEPYSYGTYSYEAAEPCDFEELQRLPCGHMLHFGGHWSWPSIHGEQNHACVSNVDNVKITWCSCEALKPSKPGARKRGVNTEGRCHTSDDVALSCSSRKPLPPVCDLGRYAGLGGIGYWCQRGNRGRPRARGRDGCPWHANEGVTGSGRAVMYGGRIRLHPEECYAALLRDIITSACFPM